MTTKTSDGDLMPEGTLPDIVTRLLAGFDPAVRQIVADLGPPKRTSTEAAREILGIRFRPSEEAHRDGARHDRVRDATEARVGRVAVALISESAVSAIVFRELRLAVDRSSSARTDGQGDGRQNGSRAMAVVPVRTGSGSSPASGAAACGTGWSRRNRWPIGGGCRAL